ncbi:MAG: 2-oxo acid dehydrogenase subunit E2 [Oscillospiraceae bacterium]|nr:2-oxo acid dehydrogenase subunit E2 [Oscillospiraceae bacterium]
MFGKRADGRCIKSIDPIFKLIPHIMTRRSDAQIFYKERIFTDVLDEYIREHREECPGINYMSIVIAALVRMLSQRPHLNRFVMNGRIFARKGIVVSFVVKKALRDNVTESNIKLTFTGKESLKEINQKVVDSIVGCKNETDDNLTDNLANFFLSFPNVIIQILVGILKYLDRIGLMPKAVLDASPFHTSFYVTNVKSLKLNYLYHHIYDFGTTSLFFAIGNSEKTVVFDREGAHHRKSITLGCTIDERICDGLYLANSLTLLKRLLRNPALLEEPLDEIVEDIK